MYLKVCKDSGEWEKHWLTVERYGWNRVFTDGRCKMEYRDDEQNSDDIQRANGLRIDKLSANYLNVTSAVHLYAQDYEAPALYKSGSTYFMFASHESGWGM
jgi:hypothetical protein